MVGAIISANEGGSHGASGTTCSSSTRGCSTSCGIVERFATIHGKFVSGNGRHEARASPARTTHLLREVAVCLSASMSASDPKADINVCFKRRMGFHASARKHCWTCRQRSARFRRPRFRDGCRVTCSAPSFHPFRKPMDSAIAVADGSLRGIPAEPAALVAIDDDNMIVVAARRLRPKLAEQYVRLGSNVGHACARHAGRAIASFFDLRRLCCLYRLTAKVF